MKTLTAPADVASRRRWAAPRYLLQVDFTAPSALTLRVSDQYVASAIGQEWLALVANWGTLEAALNTVDTGGRPATAEVSFFNTKPVGGKSRLSDLIRSPLNTSGTYEWAFAKVTVYQLFDGLASGDEVKLGVFYLEDPTEIGDERLTVRMSDQSLAIEHKMNLPTITTEALPAADPDAVGQSIPAAFGVLTKVPCWAVVAGGRTTLHTADITPTTPATGGVLNLSDTTTLPASGRIQVDDEHIDYTAKTATTVTGITRAANGTNAAAHLIGAVAFEVRSGAQAYRFSPAVNLGNFKVKAVTAVYANDVLQPAANYTITMEDAGLITGHSLVVVNFPALPVLRRQVAVTDALVVTDNIQVTVNASASAVTEAMNTPLLISLPSTSFSQNTITSASATVNLPAISFVPASVNVTVELTITQFPALLAFWSIKRGSQVIFSGQGPICPTGGCTQTIHYSRGATYANETFTIETSSQASGPFNVRINRYTSNVNGSNSVTKTGNAFRTGSITGNSAADVVVGEVTCDLEGIKDDGSGTISGTPNLLLEIPTDIKRVTLTQLFAGIAAGDLGSTWATTRASEAAAGYKWAGLVHRTEFSKLRRKLGEQSRSIIYADGGKWENKYLVDSPAAQLTLDYLKDIRSTGGRVKRTERPALKNRLRVYSQRDWSSRGALSEIYRRATTVQDLAQPGLADPLEADLELDLVQDGATANALGAYWLARWKRQRFEVEVTAWWNTLALEPVDYVAIDNHPILAAHGGTSLIFRVVERRYLLGEDNPGRTRLRLVEANP